MELLGVLIAAATTAQLSLEVEPPAAPGRHMIEAGFFTGVFIPATDHELYDSLETDHRRYNTLNPTLALRLSYFPLRYIGIEGEGAYIPSQNSDDDFAHLFTVRGHGLVQYPMRVTPFILAGGGILGSRGAPGGDVDEAFHWGVGAKYYIDHWLSVRLDGRQIYTAARGPGAGNTSHFEVLLGVSFTLFRAAEKAPWTVVDVGKPPASPPAEAPAPVEPPPPEPVSRSMVVATSTPAIAVRQALDEIHFAFGSAQLRPNSYPALDLAADVLRRNPRMRVRIVGHTDHVGSEVFNQWLSEQRAQSVKKYLVSVGVEAERLSCEGRGEASPVAPNSTVEGRALNRRSEFDIQIDGQPVDGDESTGEQDSSSSPRP